MNRTDIRVKQWEIPTLRKVVMGSYLAHRPVNVREFVNNQIFCSRNHLVSVQVKVNWA